MARTVEGNGDFRRGLKRQGPKTAPIQGERVKKIPTGLGLGFYIMVEAAGIEPASVKFPFSDLHV